jgi:hypothetical protein
MIGGVRVSTYLSREAPEGASTPVRNLDSRRRDALVALGVRDIDFHPDGTDLALIRRGKTERRARGGPLTFREKR